MNPLQQLYLQAIIKHQEQEKVKQEEQVSKQSQEILQQQQLLSLMSYTPNNLVEKKAWSLIDIQNRVTQYFQQQVLRKQVVTITNCIEYHLPYFLTVLANLIIHGLDKIQGEIEQISLLKTQYIAQPTRITMSSSLFQTLSLLLRSQLVSFDKGTQYLSKFLVFRDDFSDIFFNTLYQYSISSNQQVSQQLSFTQLNSMIKKMPEDVWGTFIFKMLSQQQQKLNKDQFLVQFNQYTVNMNNFFKKSNLIFDVVENSVKQTAQMHNDSIFQEYLLIMGSFKATTQDFLKKATSVYFEDQNDEIDLIEFNIRTQKIHKQMNCSLLYILPMLLQIESHMIDMIQQDRYNDNSQAKNSSNYYLKMIEKLKNKCVYNGEEECNCKKCQCIRRNRNSAKESQRKKREALDKIGPLQDAYEELQKKVKVIENENETLRQLLTEVFKHPTVSVLSPEFIEPLTKVIQDTDPVQHSSSYEC
ncbi:unnamed protein product [Paramecium octaurelia]|uniref:BZIP domain-containing protein n=1 Tax=Paramecium octaurelia TaxID=43137 RepID=A0A8S1UHJ8_PAROT|nr:unnamed protein product [Paramecium octaurelia]